MPRTHGYTKKGNRCYGKQDWHSKGRVNAIGALCKRTLISIGLFESYINADIFFAWLRQELLPKLKKGAVIIMDNASFHKRDDIKDLIKSSGFILEYLPEYSPDLNPIEKKWSQEKSIRRRTQCTVYELFERYG